MSPQVGEFVEDLHVARRKMCVTNSGVHEDGLAIVSVAPRSGGVIGFRLTLDEGLNPPYSKSCTIGIRGSIAL